MRKSIVILALVMLTGASFSQTAAKPKPKSAAAAPKTAAAQKTAAPAEVPEAKLPDEATVLAFYNRMFGFQENLNFKVAEIQWSPAAGVAEVTAIVSSPQGQQVSKLYVTPDGKHAISGDMIPFGKDPFEQNRELLKQSFGPVRGSKTPEMTLVEFADLECPACKAAQPNIEKLLSAMPNVQVVFQSFPLEQLHPWARQAANYLDCLYRTSNDSALTFIDAVFTHQSEITKENAADKLNGYVAMAKADPAKISACAAAPETQARIEKSIDLGKKLGITGTPTLFVNGRPVGSVANVPPDTLKNLVQFEMNQK